MTCLLKIALLEAKGLASDRSGQCNPFVVFHYNQGEKKQSPYVRRTPNPVWNLRYELDVRTSCRPLLVDLVVKSLPPPPFGPEFIGCVTFDLNRPVARDGWHVLGTRPGRADKAQGAVHLLIELSWFSTAASGGGGGGGGGGANAAGTAPTLRSLTALATLGIEQTPLQAAQTQYLRGLLKKQRPRNKSEVLLPWKLRWFVQFDDALYYFVPGKSLADGPKGKIEFKAIFEVIALDGTEFHIHCATRVFTLRAPDRYTKDYWVEGITAMRKLYSPPRLTDPERPPPAEQQQQQQQQPVELREPPYQDHTSNNFLTATAMQYSQATVAAANAAASIVQASAADKQRQQSASPPSPAPASEPIPVSAPIPVPTPATAPPAPALQTAAETPPTASPTRPIGKHSWRVGVLSSSEHGSGASPEVRSPIASAAPVSVPSQPPAAETEQPSKPAAPIEQSAQQQQQQQAAAAAASGSVVDPSSEWLVQPSSPAGDLASKRRSKQLPEELRSTVQQPFESSPELVAVPLDSGALPLPAEEAEPAAVPEPTLAPASEPKQEPTLEMEPAQTPAPPPPTVPEPPSASSDAASAPASGTAPAPEPEPEPVRTEPTTSPSEPVDKQHLDEAQQQQQQPQQPPLTAEPEPIAIVPEPSAEPVPAPEPTQQQPQPVAAPAEPDAQPPSESSTAPVAGTEPTIADATTQEQPPPQQPLPHKTPSELLPQWTSTLDEALSLLQSQEQECQSQPSESEPVAAPDPEPESKPVEAPAVPVPAAVPLVRPPVAQPEPDPKPEPAAPATSPPPQPEQSAPAPAPAPVPSEPAPASAPAPAFGASWPLFSIPSSAATGSPQPFRFRREEEQQQQQQQQQQQHPSQMTRSGSSWLRGRVTK